MGLAETERAAESLASGGFRLGATVINQVQDGTDPSLAAARASFAGTGVVELPLADAEPTGVARLRELARLLRR
jgi:arsenite/tail-anchored protein-transporting ATPase